MFCGRCGKKIADDALFCPGCGADLSAMRAKPAGTRGATDPDATTAPGSGPAVPASGAPAPDPADGRLAEQISRTRRRSRRRIPMVLIIVLVVLAVAGAALAATYVYRTFVAPPQQEEPADGQDAPAGEASDEEDAEQDGSADEEPAEEGSEGRAQRAVYDDVLSRYHDSQEQGWAGAADSDLADLASLGVIVDARTDGNSGITYSQLESGTVSYAYADLGGDGVLDLVVAVVQPDGAYQVIGLFSTDGTQVTSLMNGDLLARSWWRVLDDGRVLNQGSGGAATGSLLVYRVEGGALVPDASATMTGGSFNAWSSDPDASVDDPQQVWQELSELPDADLDWQALEDFSPAGE